MRDPGEGGDLADAGARPRPAHLVELAILLLTQRDIPDPLVVDRPEGLLAAEDLASEPGVADDLVAEPDALGVDEDAALLHRRPGQNAAVRVRHGRVALEGGRIAQLAADRQSPFDRLPGRAVRAEVL